MPKGSMFQSGSAICWYDSNITGILPGMSGLKREQGPKCNYVFKSEQGPTFN